ncbi:twin-arginine translocase subunit TatC [candidate division KSB1 bacterium]|nr:twin-arginine translocase subunit TatC [candidate division KSB1 bacterium]RQW06446.1 MAG: twin-arginine translocase subunit TatC [candidate division KSB1 bacterium]
MRGDESAASSESTEQEAAGGGKNGDDDDDDEIEGENTEKKMPFLDHLEELRWTLLRSLLAIIIGAIICFIFNEKIIQALRWVAPSNMNLVILAPTEGFMISVKVAMFAGLVLALPFVAYEFWKFIVPGLLAKEKKLVPPIVFFTVLCFLVGGAFAYFLILRFALQFLLNFQEHTENMIAIGKYLGFVVTLILVFGVVFELPVLSFFLSKIGLLTPEFLRTKRRYGIVVIFIAAALLTPPDVMTQLMLAGPLIILYEISIWVSAAAVKKNKEQEDEDLSD